MNKKDSLLNKKCESCKGKGIKAFKRVEAEDYVKQTKGWKLGKSSKSI